MTTREPSRSGRQVGAEATRRYAPGMTGRARALLDELLKLPADELREVMEEVEASGLLPDPDDDPAWVAELERRIQSVESGAVKPIPWAEARKKLEEDRRK